MLVLILPITALAAQVPEEEIKLPDIIILGETEKLLDTISLEERLRPYWNLHSLQEFEYEPYLQPEPLVPYEKKSKDYQGLVSLHGGNTCYYNLRGMFRSFSNPLLTFYAELQNRQIEKERLDRSFQGGWLPSYNNLDFALGMTYYTFQTEAKDPATENRVKINEQDHYGISLALESPGFNNSPVEVKDIYFRIAYNSYEQDLLINNLVDTPPFVKSEKIADIDLHTKVSFAMEESGLSAPVEFLLVKQSSLGLNAGVRKDDLSVLDYLSLHIIADRYALIPSIGFHSKLDVSPFVRFFLANEPQIDSRTRYDFMRDNPDQNLNLNKRLSKIPLNASLTLENDRLVPLSLSYALRWHKDYLYYGYPYQNYFIQVPTDLLEQQLSLVLSYQWQEFLVRNSFEYFNYGEEIPFLPQWQNNTTLGWFPRNFQIWSDLTFISDRQNIGGNDMEDALLLSLTARKKIIGNLTAELSAFNLLDQAYRKYELSEPVVMHIDQPPAVYQIPEEPLFVKAGLIWRF